MMKPSSGVCPEGTMLCHDSGWTEGDSKFFTCIREPLFGFKNNTAEERYDYLMANCPITDMKFI